MTSAQRIVFNTLATYSRTVFAMALGLFSSRWLLQSLGVVDFGLMAVVGGMITFVTFLNSVTAGSCARFFALSIGRGDLEETNKWFNTALAIHTVIPAILILIGWPLGEWMIGGFLNIPEGRLITARWVFRFSLVSAFWGMSSTPYMGMYTAKQNIAELSLWGVANTIGNFCFIYWLTTYKGDAWLVYAGYTVGITIFLGIGQVLRARYIFPECRVHFSSWYAKDRIRQVFSFSGWQMFGNIGVLLRGQGIAILLNKFFNPATHSYVSASYAIGYSVSGYTQTLSGALLGAFTPEIVSREGRGDRQGVLRQGNRASKFSVCLVMLFAIPLMLEINTILVLWLKKPPELAGGFCRLILSMMLIDLLTYGHMVGVNAVGKIAGYQAMLGSLIIATLPLAWLLLSLGAPALSVGWAFIVTTVCLSIGRVVWAKYLIGASPRVWYREVLLPCLCIGGGCVLIGLVSIYIWNNMGGTHGFGRLCFTVLSTTIAWSGFVWAVVMDKTERMLLVASLRKIKARVC